MGDMISIPAVVARNVAENARPTVEEERHANRHNNADRLSDAIHNILEVTDECSDQTVVRVDAGDLSTVTAFTTGFARLRDARAARAYLKSAGCW